MNTYLTSFFVCLYFCLISSLEILRLLRTVSQPVCLSTRIEPQDVRQSSWQLSFES